MQNFDDRLVIDTKRAADMLGISEHHARQMCAKGELPAFKVGSHWRVRLAELMEMMGVKR